MYHEALNHSISFAELQRLTSIPDVTVRERHEGADAGREREKYQHQRTHSAVLHFPFPPLLSNLPALRMQNFRCLAFHVWIPEARICR